MIYRDQLILDHNPRKARYGDCFRTCIAMILSKEPSEVEHYAALQEVMLAQGQGYDVSWIEVRRRLRRDHGVDALSYGNLPPGADTYLASYPQGLCIAGGPSPRGIHGGHAVVWRMEADGGYMVADPHPSRVGIMGRPETFTFLWSVL